MWGIPNSSLKRCVDWMFSIRSIDKSTNAIPCIYGCEREEVTPLEASIYPINIVLTRVLFRITVNAPARRDTVNMSNQHWQTRRPAPRGQKEEITSRDVSMCIINRNEPGMPLRLSECVKSRSYRWPKSQYIQSTSFVNVSALLRISPRSWIILSTVTRVNATRL